MKYGIYACNHHGASRCVSLSQSWMSISENVQSKSETGDYPPGSALGRLSAMMPSRSEVQSSVVSGTNAASVSLNLSNENVNCCCVTSVFSLNSDTAVGEISWMHIHVRTNPPGAVSRGRFENRKNLFSYTWQMFRLGCSETFSSAAESP